MLCSAGFHMFGCHSEKASRRWLAVDLAGILIGVIGCYLPAVHYAFYCLSVSTIFVQTQISRLLLTIHDNFLYVIGKSQVQASFSV